MAKAGVRIRAQVMRWPLQETSGAGFQTCPELHLPLCILLPLPPTLSLASFNAAQHVFGLSGNLVIRTPVAL